MAEQEQEVEVQEPSFEIIDDVPEEDRVEATLTNEEASEAPARS